MTRDVQAEYDQNVAAERDNIAAALDQHIVTKFGVNPFGVDSRSMLRAMALEDAATIGVALGEIPAIEDWPGDACEDCGDPNPDAGINEAWLCAGCRQ